MNKKLLKLNVCEKTLKTGKKVSKLSADAIKLKVSQDAALWDVEQKLKQVQTNREQQQKTVVELQMQNENLTAQYQEKTRQRPELLNKVNSTRELYDVLESSTQQLTEIVLRCKGDTKNLGEAFDNNAGFFQEMKDSHQRAQEKYEQTISCLNLKAKLTEEHHVFAVQQLKVLTEAVNEKIRTQRNDARNQLANITLQVAELEADQKRDEAKLKTDFNLKMGDANNTLQARKKSLKEAIEEMDKLEIALTNQEEFCKLHVDQKNELQAKTAVLEEEKMSVSKEIETLRKNLEQDRVSYENAKKQRHDLTESVQVALNQLQEKDHAVNSLISEKEKLRSKISAAKEATNNLKEALKEAERTSSSTSQRINELNEERTKLCTALHTQTTTYNNYKNATNSKIQHLKETVERQKEQLKNEGPVAAEMITELQKNRTEANELESALELATKQLQDEQHIVEERDNQIKQLQSMLVMSSREKDGQLQSKRNSK